MGRAARALRVGRERGQQGLPRTGAGPARHRGPREPRPPARGRLQRERVDRRRLRRRPVRRGRQAPTGQREVQRQRRWILRPRQGDPLVGQFPGHGAHQQHPEPAARRAPGAATHRPHRPPLAHRRRPGLRRPRLAGRGRPGPRRRGPFLVGGRGHGRGTAPRARQRRARNLLPRRRRTPGGRRGRRPRSTAREAVGRAGAELLGLHDLRPGNRAPRRGVGRGPARRRRGRRRATRGPRRIRTGPVARPARLPRRGDGRSTDRTRAGRRATRPTRRTPCAPRRPKRTAGRSSTRPSCS